MNEINSQEHNKIKTSILTYFVGDGGTRRKSESMRPEI